MLHVRVTKDERSKLQLRGMAPLDASPTSRTEGLERTGLTYCGEYVAGGDTVRAVVTKASGGIRADEIDVMYRTPVRA
jgi:hypothetical protein